MEKESIENNAFEVKAEVALCRAPNQHARPCGFAEFEDFVVLKGYQEFLIYFYSKSEFDVLPLDPLTKIKWELLSKYFSLLNFENRKVLDVGANNGFFGFKSIAYRASNVRCVDLDDRYVTNSRMASGRLGLSNISFLNQDVTKLSDPADVVFALALVHWLYSCTACLGSLDEIIRILANLTNGLLFIEWVAPNDPAILEFGHLTFFKGQTDGDYTQVSFEKALTRYFSSWELIGNVRETRVLYVARKAHYSSIPWHVPRRENMKLIYDRHIYSSSEQHYWSRIYQEGGNVVKETSGELAENEFRILANLDSSYFPKVSMLSESTTPQFFFEEFIDGSSLSNLRDFYCKNYEKFYSLIDGMLVILRELEHSGIVHRDFTPGNIMLKGDCPVLIDFGWAISENVKSITPTPLGDSPDINVRPPSNISNDLYAFLQLLEWLNLGGDQLVVIFCEYLKSLFRDQILFYEVEEIELTWRAIKSGISDLDSMPRPKLSKRLIRTTLQNFCYEIKIMDECQSREMARKESNINKLKEIAYKLHLQIAQTAERLEHTLTLNKKLEQTLREKNIAIYLMNSLRSIRSSALIVGDFFVKAIRRGKRLVGKLRY